MLTCHRCKKDLGSRHIVYQDYEGARLYHYHETCALKVKEEVINEYFNLMFRIMHYKLPKGD